MHALRSGLVVGVFLSPYAAWAQPGGSQAVTLDELSVVATTPASAIGGGSGLTVAATRSVGPAEGR